MPGGVIPPAGALSAGVPMLGGDHPSDGSDHDFSARRASTGHARPACTPAAIRAVLAANADAAVLQHHDDELDAAFEQAREHGDLTPLLDTVRRWRFEADAWRDPGGPARVPRTYWELPR